MPTYVTAITETNGIKLPPKQRKFAEAYLDCLVGSRAAQKAGYPKKTAAFHANKLLKEPTIKAYIATRQADIDRETTISAGFFRQKLLDNLERAMEGVPITNKDGTSILYWKCDLNAANKTLELIGKHTGYLESRIAVTHHHDHNISIDEQARRVALMLAEADRRMNTIDADFSAVEADQAKSGQSTRNALEALTSPSEDAQG